MTTVAATAVFLLATSASDRLMFVRLRKWLRLLLLDSGSEERALNSDLEELYKNDPDWDRPLRKLTVKHLMREGILSREELCLGYGRDVVEEVEADLGTE